MTESPTCSGGAGRRFVPSAPVDAAAEATESLESAIAAAVAFARRGDWAAAEAAIYRVLAAVPREDLPRAYIACVDLVAGLDAAVPPTPLAAGRARRRAVPAEPRPRLLARADPAVDYAHAVVTALRGRLNGTRPTLTRQAS
jgi:hypothetical protein